jgi:ABC-type polysaccharide/polyol phosphate export permease
VRLYDESSLLHRAAAELRALIRNRELIRYLVRSDLRARTTGRIFGFLWWLLDPLLLMVTYLLLVVVIFHRGGHAYPVYIFTSIIAFRFLTTSVQGAMARTLGAQGMKQVLFPRSVFPLAATIGEVFHYAFGVAILLVFAIPFGILPKPVDFFIILVVAVQFLFLLGLAFALSALNVFVRDIQNVMTYVFRMMFYASPALLSLDNVSPAYRKYFMLNPMSPLFLSYHDIVSYQRLPHFFALGVLSSVSAVLLVFGYLLFVKLEPQFSKVL